MNLILYSFVNYIASQILKSSDPDHSFSYPVLINELIIN